MDCHDVRVLQALLRRESAIDPTERAALQQHLDACPDCAALTHSEQVVDIAFGSAMRAVTVPAGLETRLLTRLAATRTRRWPKVAAAAAAALLLIAGATWWALPRRPHLDTAVFAEVAGRRGIQPSDVERWYAERGINMLFWPDADPQCLSTFDIVEFHGRRVPKLIFCKEVQGIAAVAEVWVLSTSDFDTRDLPTGESNGISPNISVEKYGSAYVYLIATNAPGGPVVFRLIPQG